MMVASTSLLEIQQSHRNRYMNVKHSESDMAYRIQQHSSHQAMETQDMFHPRHNNQEDISDMKYSLPKYNKEHEGKSCFSPMFPNSRNADSLPLPDSEFNTLAGRQVNQGSFSRNQRSPSGMSPPSKRHSLTPRNHSTEPRDCISPSEVSAPHKRIVQAIETPRYSTVLNNTQGNVMVNSLPIEQFNTSPVDLPATSSMGYESKDFQLPNEANESENSLPSLSPGTQRHPSQSSVHSSNSSAMKSTTPKRSSSAKLSKTTTKAPAQVPNYLFDDDDDDSWKVCSVCGDKATGYHFNALTCEGCKGFFRRSMKNRKNFTCPYTGNCVITKSNRRQCQACRLQKCLRIGMKKECIMSHTEIQMKKNLMLNNKIKRSIMEWKPLDFTQERQQLAELIQHSHSQTNNPPNIKDEDGIITVERHPGASPSSSMHSGFSDLINQMTQDIVATAPGQKSACKAHVRHFSAIMEFSIKEIIKFCKKIPTFTNISLKDQITLLKSGCTEILFIKANYTYDREQNALMCGPGKYYTRESFLAGGMSEEYTDSYLQFHHDLSHMMLDDTELACICAATLFSSDRDELEDRDAVERQQEDIVVALQAYTENTYHCRLRFPKIMAYLTRLRTLNWHISKTLKKLQNSNADDVTPLVLEVVPTV